MRFGIVFFGIGLALTIGCGSSDPPSDSQALVCDPGMEPCLSVCVPLGTCTVQNTGATTGNGVGGTGQSFTGASGTGQQGTGSAGQGTGAIQTNAGNGAANTGNTGGTSGTTKDPTPVALSCKDSASTVTVKAEDVVSDFNQDKPIMYKVGKRGGTNWYPYTSDKSPESNPGAGSNAFAVDKTKSGPCNSGGSLHVSSPGNTDWGVGFGVNFNDITASVKGAYDASADGYTGFGFWMNCSKEVQFTFFKIPDAANDADIEKPICSYTANPQCNQYGVKNNVIVANQWVYYRVYFNEMLQDWDNDWANNQPGTGLNIKELTAFQVQMNTKYMRDGTTRQANPFDCWIDDVHLLREPAPKTPAASDTYTTQGNKILKNGTAVILKGLARPSLEWDPSGFGITREDIQRMKVWGPKINVVRYSLNQGFWLKGHENYNPLYEAYVDRVVQWTLQEGLAVILDLHWTSKKGQTQMADKQSIEFWKQVATKYKNDGRIMFELFNEPYQISTTQWLSGDGTYAGMQQMYDAVRATGAKNVVMVGGLDWAYDLSHVASGTKVNGTNIVYVTHPYGWKAQAGDIERAYGKVAATYPVIATEFGYADVGGASANNCYESEYSRLLSDFTTRGLSWTGWAWLVDDARCGFPTLIDSYSGDTTEPGAIVKNALK